MNTKESAKFQFKTFQSKGEYDYVQMEFDAILEGDVKANKIQCNGSSKIIGNVDSLELILNGVSNIKGNCKCGNIEIHGESNIEGTIRSKDFILNGTLVGPEKMKIDKFILKNGSLKAEWYLQSEDISGKGGIIAKELRGGEINLELTKKSAIDIVTGKNISIKAGSTGLFGKLVAGKTTEIKEIQCETLYLENVKSNIIKGNNIVLGKGCNIQKIEYTGTLKNENGSTVGEEVKG